MVDALTFINNIALLGAVKAIDAVHHHGFPGTVGPDYRMDFALANLKVDAGQGFNLAEGHMNVFQIQQDIAFF